MGDGMTRRGTIGASREPAEEKTVDRAEEVGQAGGCVDQRAELPSGNEVVVWSSDPINERHDEVDAGVVRHDAVEALHRLSGPSGLERLGAVDQNGPA